MCPTLIPDMRDKEGGEVERYMEDWLRLIKQEAVDNCWLFGQFGLNR